MRNRLNQWETTRDFHSQYHTCCRASEHRLCKSQTPGKLFLGKQSTLCLDEDLLILGSIKPCLFDPFWLYTGSLNIHYSVQLFVSVADSVCLKCISECEYNASEIINRKTIRNHFQTKQKQLFFQLHVSTFNHVWQEQSSIVPTNALHEISPLSSGGTASNLPYQTGI